MATQRPRISKPTDERRAEIVECARRLFAERGFTATKISAIVRELGGCVSKVVEIDFRHLRAG
ncbi:TetR family transcriptional regulator [Profundibacter sp.]|uniref:TetR family transcriptional regulator n=1 Tax=Profundibacter sp. TaxID=3101071 RepID=UPI003D0D1661